MDISLHHLRAHRLIAMAPGAEANAQPSAAELAETRTEKQNAPPGSPEKRAAIGVTTAGRAAETAGNGVHAAHETAQAAGAGQETQLSEQGVVNALKLPGQLAPEADKSTAAPERTISLPDYAALTREADAQIKQNAATEAGKPKRPDIAAVAKGLDAQMKQTGQKEADKAAKRPNIQELARNTDTAIKKAGQEEADKATTRSATLTTITREKSAVPTLTDPLGQDSEKHRTLGVSHTKVEGKPAAEKPADSSKSNGETGAEGNKKEAPKSPEQAALDAAKLEFKQALPPQLMEQGQKFLDTIQSPKDTEAVIQLAQHLAGMEKNAQKMMFLRRTKESLVPPKDLDAWRTLHTLFERAMPTEAGGGEQTADKGKTELSTDKAQGEKPSDNKEKGDQLSPEETREINKQGKALIEKFNSDSKNMTPEAKLKEQSKVEGQLQMAGIDPGTVNFGQPDRAAALQGTTFERGMNKLMGMVKFFMEILDTKKETKNKDKKTTYKKETKTDAPAATPATKTVEGTPASPAAKPAEAGAATSPVERRAETARYLPPELQSKLERGVSPSKEDMQKLADIIRTADENTLNKILQEKMFPNPDSRTIDIIKGSQIASAKNLEERRTAMIDMYTKVADILPSEKKSDAADTKGPEKTNAKSTPEKPTEDIQTVKGNVEARLRDTLKNFADDPKTAELAARFVSIKAENGTYQVFLDEKAAQNNGVSPENIVKFSSVICSMDTRDMNSGVSKTEPMTEKDFRNYAEQLTMRVGTDLSKNMEGALKNVRGDSPDKQLPSFVKVMKLPNGKYQVSIDNAVAGNNVPASVLGKLNETYMKNGINQQHLKQGTVTGEFDEKQLWDLALKLDASARNKKEDDARTSTAGGTGAF